MFQYLFKKTNQSYLAWVQYYAPHSSIGTGEKEPELLLARTPTGSVNSEQGREEWPHQCERLWVPLTSRLLWWKTKTLWGIQSQLLARQHILSRWSWHFQAQGPLFFESIFYFKRYLGLMRVLGQSDGLSLGDSLQHSCLENSMDRAAWWATVHRIAKEGHVWAHIHIHPPLPRPRIPPSPKGNWNFVECFSLSPWEINQNEGVQIGQGKIQWKIHRHRFPFTALLLAKNDSVKFFLFWMSDSTQNILLHCCPITVHILNGLGKKSKVGHNILLWFPQP